MAVMGKLSDPEMALSGMSDDLECTSAHAAVSAKTPSQQVALVLSTLAEGLDLSATG